MARLTYEQARADHEYLWMTYAPAADMTGGYVDQDDLDKLLKSPTKRTATACYVSQIKYWFQIGPDDQFGRIGNSWKGDPEVLEIAIRYDHADEVEWTGDAASAFAEGHED